TTALTVTRDQIAGLGKGSNYLGNNALFPCWSKWFNSCCWHVGVQLVPFCSILLKHMRFKMLIYFLTKSEYNVTRF
ncbi:hypothetical protein, partial [Vibrio vulnificus]|uniref:hypothetical protein n=1 Tax=Vibrio vulnificus TaxID=672 RepID=UPI003242C396